jgi:integrase
MGRKGSGVEVREASIRLFFVVDGKRHRETLTVNGEPMAPTPANLKYAERTAAEIRDKIKHGTFKLAEYFPDSKRAKAEPTSLKEFGPLADAWLKSKGGLAAATLDQYRNAIKVWKALLGARTPVERLDHATLASKIGEHPWKSPKLLNNYLIPLRGAFGLVYRGRRAADSPLVGIGNRRVPVQLPDPLTASERDRILADMADHYDPRITAYFRFMFYTGMRPEEAIALRWSDIDEAGGVARVQRVRTFRGSERDDTKTGFHRDVDLVPMALAALKVMRPHTSMRGEDPDVFQNPVTRKPWHDERSQRDHYWHPTLRRLRIRGRRPYSTRHTYCTVALMGGVAPAYIATQAGHSVKVLLEKYARWIPGADGGAERRRLADVMANSSPAVPCENDESAKVASDNGNFGRRDWTRTTTAGGKRGR